jgi:ribulose-phosphate 3-epimerase
MIELCASVLAANHAYIARDLLEAERCGIRTFHFDVSDGHYAKYLLFGSQLITDVRSLSNAYFDVHLAVFNMSSILETFLPTGADRINLQYESADAPLERLIDRVHEYGRDVCLTFTPETPYREIEPYFDKVEAVNLLAVNPGIGGQQFNTRVLDKVSSSASYISSHHLNTQLSVDGGVNKETIRSVMTAGADMAIVGSGIFCGSIEQNITELLEIIA